MVNISRYTGITFIAYSSETRFESEANDSVDCRFLKFSFVEGVVPVQPAKVDCVAYSQTGSACGLVGGGIVVLEESLISGLMKIAIMY